MAITTVYDGIEYRSRLEARWAAFMRNIGWEFVYEPFDGDGYIPDFLVQGPRPMLVEVKPAVTLAEYQAAVPKAEKGLAAHWSHDILIVGASPLPSAPFAEDNGYSTEDKWIWPPAGLLGEYVDYKAQGWMWGNGLWYLPYRGHHGFGVFHEWADWEGRPCGCCRGVKDSNHTQSRSLLESFWADACNDVKWRGRAT